MKDSQVAVLLEKVDGKLQSLAESVSVLAQDIAEIKPQVARISDMAVDIKVIKIVQAEQSRDIRHMEQYLSTQVMPARA